MGRNNIKHILFSLTQEQLLLANNVFQEIKNEKLNALL